MAGSRCNEKPTAEPYEGPLEPRYQNSHDIEPVRLAAHAHCASVSGSCTRDAPLLARVDRALDRIEAFAAPRLDLDKDERWSVVSDDVEFSGSCARGVARVERYFHVDRNDAVPETLQEPPGDPLAAVAEALARCQALEHGS